MKPKFAFIYFSDGCHPEAQQALVTGPACDTWVVGVSSFDEAREQAIRFAAEGCASLEFCGAFDNADFLASVRAVVDEKVAIGAVRLDHPPAFS